jgi:hypothetical protein
MGVSRGPEAQHYGSVSIPVISLSHRFVTADAMRGLCHKMTLSEHYLMISLHIKYLSSREAQDRWLSWESSRGRKK